MGQCGLNGRSVGGDTVFVRFYDRYGFCMTISDSKMGSLFPSSRIAPRPFLIQLAPENKQEVATGDAGFFVIFLPRKHIRDYKMSKNIDRFIKNTPKSTDEWQKLSRSRDLHFFETSSFRFKHGPGERRSVMTTQAEVTFPHERHLQLICLFMLVSVKKIWNVSVCVCVILVENEGHRCGV